MFDQVFGNYLVESGRMTKEQFAKVIERQSTVRVKLGLIAVSDKLMTAQQADEVNMLQSVMDKRFGDIAVEKGYLTDDQVGLLLKKQGNLYLTFVQTLVDEGICTLEDIAAYLDSYRQENGLSATEMADFVSGDPDKIIALFLPADNSYCARLCSLAVRTLIRIVDSSAYISKAYRTDMITADQCAVQEIAGAFQLTSGFAGAGKNLLAMAVPFAKEEFEEVDMDALDAVGEFTNCVNGLFSSALSEEDVEIDMLPPAFYLKNFCDNNIENKTESKITITGSFYVLPVMIRDCRMDFIVSLDSPLKIQ